MSVYHATYKFAALVTLVDEDADLGSVVTLINKTITDTTAELLGKQRWKRKLRLLERSAIFVTKDERGDVERAKTYSEIRRKIRTEMKAKGTWIEGHCHFRRITTRKHTMYQLVMDLTTEKQSKSTTIQHKSKEMFCSDS